MVAAIRRQTMRFQQTIGTRAMSGCNGDRVRGAQRLLASVSGHLYAAILLCPKVSSLS